jgi:adenosine deaminase CECR1
MSMPSYDEYSQLVKDIGAADVANRISKDEPELTANEKKLEAYMVKSRSDLIGDRWIFDAYSPVLMFNKSKADIEHNDLFTGVFGNKTLKMPAGGNLHIHTSSIWNSAEFIDYLIGLSAVYIYWDPDQTEMDKPKYKHGTFFYLSKKPEDAKFLLCQDREQFTDKMYAETQKLYSFINEVYDQVEYAWDAFNDYFTRVGKILKVREVYRKYYAEALKYQFSNGLSYIELRAGVGELKDNNDGDLSAPNDFETITLTDDVPEGIAIIYDEYSKLKKVSGYEHCKLKIIASTSRSTDDITAAVELVKKIPGWQANLKDTTEEGKAYDFIVGFDLVSEEDRGHKTDDYAQAILNDAEIQAHPVDFYFHDGESNWVDDENVIAAYAMGTKRIGHGLNVYNFPDLMERLGADEICLEVCPISNQMLRYMKDLRIHPISEYVNRGVQCVVASDDPQIFDTVGLAYDLWEVWHGSMIDLRDLKKLLRNSFIYSAMSAEEKADMMGRWEADWIGFVDKVAAGL